jgi:hypothetical protein
VHVSPSGRQESRYGNTADYAVVVDYADASVFVVDYSEVDVAFVPSHPKMNRIATHSLDMPHRSSNEFKFFALKAILKIEDLRWRCVASGC